MKKIYASFVVLLVLIFSFSLATQSEAAGSKLGKKVSWADISLGQPLLNNAVVSFKPSKESSTFAEVVDKNVKYINTYISDKQLKEVKKSTYYSETSIGAASNEVTFTGKQKSKTVYALIVFYDKNKKVIAHQQQKLTVKKLEIKDNRSIKKLSNNILSSNKSTKMLNIDFGKQVISDAAYYSFHANLKSLTPSKLLQTKAYVNNYHHNGYSMNPIYYLPYEDYKKKKKGTIYTTILFYDAKFKPIAYVSAKFKASDFE